MRRQHPAPRAEILVSAHIHSQLISASIETGFAKEDWEIAAEAIDEWTRRHNPDALAGPAIAGYQWKRVFLPDGTVLRTIFRGKNYHCIVDGDAILFNGKAMSPSGFVNAVGGVRRNAWNCTWILFPDTKEWKLASDLRGNEGAPRARKTTGSARPASQARPDPSMEHAAAPPASAPPQAKASIEAPRRDRRIGNAPDERSAAALHRQLLPLLLRLCNIDESRQRPPATPGRLTFAPIDREPNPIRAACFPVNLVPAYPGAGLRLQASSA